MAPPPRSTSGKGRGRGGGRGDDQRLYSEHHHTKDEEDQKLKKRERGSPFLVPTKRNGGRGGHEKNLITSSSSTRPTRIVTTILKKLIVRNLPIGITQEEVRTMLSTHGLGDDVIWRFVPGQTHKKQMATPARLYLDMKHDPEKSRKLIAALDGQYLYSDTKTKTDMMKPMDVEFAPFQKFSREKQRRDAKLGTIGRDPEYVAFLDELSKPRDKLPSAEALVDMTEGEIVEKPVAALVKYLNEKKVHSREKSKGKSGGKSIGKNARRLKGNKAQKSTKDNLKLVKERKRRNSVDTVDLKGRKQHGRAAAKKEPTKQESTEPGTLRIVTPKPVAVASGSNLTPAAKWNGIALSADACSERRLEKHSFTKGGKKSGSRGRSNPQKSKFETDGADGEGANVKPPSRRKGGNSGKNESSNKGERKKKVFAPKDATAQGTPSKS